MDHPCVRERAQWRCRRRRRSGRRGGAGRVAVTGAVSERWQSGDASPLPGEGV